MKEKLQSAGLTISEHNPKNGYNGAIKYLINGKLTQEEAVATLNEYAVKALRILTGDRKAIGEGIQKDFGAFIAWNRNYQREKKIMKNNPFKKAV